MDQYEVRWSREAIYDIADIEDYIELAFGVDRAERFHKDIDEECEALGKAFKFYSGTGIYYRDYMIFRKSFSPSIIFYVVDNDRQEVSILRVLRHERDWQRVLRETIFYTFD